MFQQPRRLVRIFAATAVALAATVLVPEAAQAWGPRPHFQLPLPCGQTWEASTYDGHSPDQDSIDLGLWFTWRGRKYNISSGQRVLASAGGTVSQVGIHDGGTAAGPGNYVYLDHGGGWVTHYMHLRDAPLVAVNDVVAAGQQIGWVGNTGTMAPHLHYTQLEDGVAVRVQFAGVNINTHAGNLSPWGNGERITSGNCGGKNIVAQHSGKCLTVPDNANDGARVYQSSCNGRWNQMWTFVYGGMGHYRLQSMRNGKCLDVAGGFYAGAPVVQNTCDWVSSQSWLIGRQPNTDQNTWWDYRPASDLCLDVPAWSHGDGVEMEIYHCNGGGNQIFKTVNVSSGTP